MPIVILLLLAARASGAARDGAAGQRALLRAEFYLAKGQVDEGQAAVAQARESFSKAQSKLSFGFLAPAVRVTPMLGSQLRQARQLAQVGEGMAQFTGSVLDSVAAVTDQGDTSGGRLVALRGVRDAVAATRGFAQAAAVRVTAQRNPWLWHPLAGARQQVIGGLGSVALRSKSAVEGLDALLVFLGDAGPRRYLFLSQNPDELRPTGGYIGTYGVVTAVNGKVDLDRYDAIEDWFGSHPDAVVPPEEAPAALQIPNTPVRQTLANVNITPHWPDAAQLATELWVKGGEEPVDGVVTFTPEFLVRVVELLGPVDVPAYGERVTAANLIARLDYHTHVAPPRVGRKDFIADLAEAVLKELVDAPSSIWPRLALASAKGLDAREAMVWSKDGLVAAALNRSGWDGAVSASGGDFFQMGEFEYGAKNGRGIRRTFAHRVTLRADGSGLVETTVTIRNTGRPSNQNPDSASYVTLYGPQGATLSTDSDPPLRVEDPIAGHPAAAWLLAAPPLGQVTVTISWEVPALLVRGADGLQEYRLAWKRVPANSGDVLSLDVSLPTGWGWADTAPPGKTGLVDDVTGAWKIVADRRR